MLVDNANDVFELLRSGFPYYVILFLPFLILISPINPVDGAHEFAVYRMQQFDFQGNPRGCRNSLINVEARTFESGVFARRCVIIRLLDLNPFKYRDIISQGASGLLILVPNNFTTLSSDDRQHVLELESSFLSDEIAIPVYFAVESKELIDIYKSIENSNVEDQRTSAAEAILNSVISTGFQLVSNTAQSKPLPEAQILSIQGKLSGYGIEDQLPTIALVAHYDSFGMAPGLAFGADSNGSGVAALMELARLFSRLYSNSKTQPKFNILFMLSGGGKFSYQGTKKWIEDNLDSPEGGLLTDSVYTLCLDSIGNGNNLYLHVSKPPKDGSSGALLVQELKKVSQQFYPDVNFDMIHKKINLADTILAWEHERFSIRRLPAFTLSQLSNSKESQRNSILDTRDQVDVEILHRNVKIIAESLGRHIYNLTQPDIEVFSNTISVEKDYLESWLDHLTRKPRPAQILSEMSKNNLLVELEQGFSRYLTDVKVTTTKADKRDPEFTFYDVVTTTMTAYSVKPVVFDLVLMIAVGVYLAGLYFLIQAFPMLYGYVSQMGLKLKQT